MKLFWQEDHLKTKFIRINNRACTACWKCIETCANGVIGKVDFLCHKHSHIDHPNHCRGCLKCERACDAHAITRIPKRTEVSAYGTTHQTV